MHSLSYPQKTPTSISRVAPLVPPLSKSVPRPQRGPLQFCDAKRKNMEKTRFKRAGSAIFPTPDDCDASTDFHQTSYLHGRSDGYDSSVTVIGTLPAQIDGSMMR